MLKNNNPRESSDEYINYLGLLLDKPSEWYKEDSVRKPRTHLIIALVLSIIATVSAFFIKLPGLEWIWNVLGVALGLCLFVPSYFLVTGLIKKKEDEDEDWISPKKRKSPTQRIRIGIGFFVASIIFLIIVLSGLPSIAGGIVIVGAVAGIYSFISRTEEEYIAYLEGEIDPRDVVDEAEPEADEAEKLSQAEAYIEVVNSLPEEQRRIILNSKVNGMIAVEEESSKKSRRR